MSTALAQMPVRTLSGVFAEKYAIDHKNVFTILRETALKSKDPVTDAEVAAFMVVCNQYDLNPFIKEIFGFISKGKMQYVISVDGWTTLINRQSALNGIEFEEHFDGNNVRSITCKIHRKDRALPTVVTEYFSECRGETDTWKRWPVRMLRHKALIQCSRLAFGLAGVMDDDEAERMQGFPGIPQVLEGGAPADPQAESMMEQLGWPEGKRAHYRRNFAQDAQGMRVYLRTEIEKLSRPRNQESVQQSGATAAQQQAEPEAGPAAEYADSAAEYVEDQPATAASSTQAQPANRAARRSDW